MKYQHAVLWHAVFDIIILSPSRDQLLASTDRCLVNYAKYGYGVPGTSWHEPVGVEWARRHPLHSDNYLHRLNVRGMVSLRRSIAIWPCSAHRCHLVQIWALGVASSSSQPIDCSRSTSMIFVDDRPFTRSLCWSLCWSAGVMGVRGRLVDRQW